MLGIGQFAQLAKVSVRTLRYYGDHGLLMPAHVDPSSGYRSYNTSQLADLNRILVMKDLGLSLDEIQTFVAEQISIEDLISLAKERQVEAEEEIEHERRRLDRVAVRIASLRAAQNSTAKTSTAKNKGSSSMSLSTTAVVIKSLDPVRLATASEVVSGFDADLGAVFGRLYPLIFGELGRLGIVSSAPTMALYEEHADGVEIIAAAQIPADAEFTSPALQRLDLPKVDRAATLVHSGDMRTIGESHQSLLEWVGSAGEAPTGFTRELYLQHDGPQERWVTELQSVLG